MRHCDSGESVGAGHTSVTPVWTGLSRKRTPDTGHRTVPIGEVLVHRQNFPPRRRVSRATELGGITECGLRVGPCEEPAVLHD